MSGTELGGIVECAKPEYRLISGIDFGDLFEMNAWIVTEYARQVLDATCMPNDMYNALMAQVLNGSKVRDVPIGNQLEDRVRVDILSYTLSEPFKGYFPSMLVKDLRDIAYDENFYVPIPARFLDNILAGGAGGEIQVFEQVLSVLSRAMSNDGIYNPWSDYDLGRGSVIFDAERRGSRVRFDSFGSLIIRTGVRLDEPGQRPLFFETTLVSHECAICLSDIESGTPQAVLPCSHTYHGKCIDQWLRNTCPDCREGYSRALDSVLLV